ncbi:hypothetical protein EUTSA_v10002307mg [Eutrema salsugineum]|uniref:Ubiquitin-like protease family profile domain-containing protein n=1 Tax=Eutrema salsugineum TaxID=72664 RepID=V4NU83_EUTSA|nr:hypothetical protein EUTSA_v10002307mg [Eutrema salsugineum]
MVASEFPRRLYTKGGEPAPDKSIGYYADNYRLVPALKSALQEDEWEEIYESPLGVFLKFHDLDFGWASRLVHHMLTFQIVCKQRYEIWSLIGTTPVWFSLHEFEEITGLNCGYVDDLAVTDLELSDDMHAFWELMGVDVESGPSTIEIIEACSNCSSWSWDDRLRLGYLGIYAGFILATRPGLSTNVNHARLVMDLEGFKEFPWGRIAFHHLIKSVKEKDLSKNIYIEGFVQALQVWVYYALPDFAAEFGEPLPNDISPLMLAYKGSRGRKNVKANMLKHARIQCCVAKDLADMFPICIGVVICIFMPVCDNKLQSNSVKDDAPMKDNVNVSACESVNAPGDAKGKKAAMKEEEAPEPSFCEIDPKTCDVDFDAVALAKNAKARAAAQIVARAMNARNQQLAATQKSPTAKAIIPTSASHSGRVHGYDPFDQTGVKAKHTTLMNFLKANPLHSCLIFINVQHMEAYINVQRLRLSKHPEWFVVCIRPDLLPQLHVCTIWRHDYNDFQKCEPNADGSGKLLPPRAYSYYTGELPIYCQTKKTWAYDVDYLYSMLHITEDHWVAIWVSFVSRHITIWDSHAGAKHASDAQIDEAMEPLAVMIPYLLQTCAPDDDKWRFSYTPFTHSRVPGEEIPQNIQSGDCGVYCLKYIECHALDLPFPKELCDKNIQKIREKMAAEIFDEISARGHDELDATGMDVYDRKA